ncbi:MGMT family protein [Motilibacter aurantiacus]|uniref:MGMT family protein n=1 Tax=Motilibacter aurantiacus TaxID=2714955 RepID=UPI0014078197|nr:MGMT family protein [Motilibacter aurantiacus]NHC45668.1 cysteine methyltransferase [Motilibacter aurantiacus]
MVVPTPYAERVLRVVESIPRGQVATYGDIAELLGEGGPRGVGRVMSEWGGGVAWWRVVRAGGLPAPGHEEQALRRLAEDGVPLRGQRVDLARCRWVPEGPDVNALRGPD